MADPTERPAGGEPTEAVARGIEHLQSAGREVIAAMRSLLDACEEVVNDPDTLRSATSEVSSLAKTVRRTIVGLATSAVDRDEPGATGGGVERIELD